MPNPVPVVIPIKPGSAKGLRNNACSAAPDTASEAPANSPIIVRGILI